MGYYRSFRTAIPLQRAGYSRVTHPFAAFPRCKHLVLARLACVRHAASVHPEPGSNSSIQTHCICWMHLPVSSCLVHIFWAFRSSLFDFQRSKRHKKRHTQRQIWVFVGYPTNPIVRYLFVIRVPYCECYYTREREYCQVWDYVKSS